MALTNSWPGVSGLTDTTEARKAFSGLVETDTGGTPRTGVFPAHSGPLVTARADMQLDVALFQAVANQFGGAIFFANDGSRQLDAALVSPGAGTNFYVVYAKQNESTAPGTDANNNLVLTAALSTTSFAVARASLPAGAVELATVQMPTGKTGTNNAGVTILPTFNYTAAEGGTVWVRNSTELAAWTPANGSVAYQMDTSTLYLRQGGAWVSFTDIDDTGWVSTSPSANWTLTANVFYRKKNGIVFLKGIIARTTGTDNIITIPAGFRPGENAAFAVASTSATASVRVVVTTAGLVSQLPLVTDGGGLIYLHSVQFPAEL